jgi:hypothetical protein
VKVVASFKPQNIDDRSKLAVRKAKQDDSLLFGRQSLSVKKLVDRGLLVEFFVFSMSSSGFESSLKTPAG